MKRSENIGVWKLVCAYAKAGSLKAASDAMELDPAAASRLISALETELGVALIDRSRKPAVPTEALTAILPYARRIVKAERSILSLTRDRQRTPVSGRVIRVSVPSNMSRSSFLDPVARFAEKHDGLRVEFVSGAGMEWLKTGEVDLAILSYRPEESDLLALPLKKNVPLILATSHYLELHGTPETPEDLKRHTLIMQSRSDIHTDRPEYLYKGDSAFYIGDMKHVIYGDGVTRRTALAMSRGIALDIDCALVPTELASGIFVPVLPGWHRKPWDNHICVLRRNADDRLLRELMSVIRKSFYTHLVDSWKYWYRHFGFPIEDVRF